MVDLSLTLMEGSTVKCDIINFMNIAILQDYSKYNSLLKKVKENMSRDTPAKCDDG